RAASMTAPNPNAQADLLVKAWEMSQVDPATITYMEAHGTGTALGDPIEITGLKKAFTRLYAKAGKALPAEPHCGIGSVKSNLGHLERASGIAGMLKVLLAMKHRTLPASINIIEVNPYIKLEGTPFQIVRQTRPWAVPLGADGKPVPRRAGVSSFGMGGVNGHVVLEEYLPAEPEAEPITSPEPQLFVLSAKGEEPLRHQAENLARFLEEPAGDALIPLEPPAAGPTEEVRALAASVLGLDIGDLDLEEPLSELGFEVETYTRFQQELGERFALAPGRVSQYATLAGLAAEIGAGPGADGPATRASSVDLRRVAYTLQVGREPYPHRLAVAAGGASELAARLRAFAAGELPPGAWSGLVRGGKKAKESIPGESQVRAALASGRP
ncbi:MAG: polyketide synthase, partial [Acidobacteria bacterium]|nr:polyketide synthase [Acidobacteriota bacterium]